MSTDPTITLSSDSSEPNVHDRCNGESSSSDDPDTAQQNNSQWHFVDDTSEESNADDSGSEPLIFDTLAGGWTFESITQSTAQIALDAVRYQPNYSRSMTSKLCLHYINTIRKRVSGGLTNYLFNVDGCVSSLIEATGRCEIYYCRPYTYELQVKQKAVGSDVFIVQSIYKTVDEKTLDEYRNEESNLDWSTAMDVETGAKDKLDIEPTVIPLETEQRAAWQGAVNAFIEDSSFVDDEEAEPIAWTNDVNNFWQSATPTQQVTTQPLSLRAEPMSLLESEPEVVNSDHPGATTVAIIGIAAVAVSTVAFVLALVVSRWRTQVKSIQRKMSQEYAPLRGTLNTAESTISMTSRDSIGPDAKQIDFDKVEFFG